MNRILNFFSILLISACSTGHIVTTNLHNLASFEENSQIYTLPKTRLVVNVRIEKNSYTPGPYYRYAKKYFEIEDVSSVESDFYEITDIGVKTQSISDPDYCYSLRNENYERIEELLKELRKNGLVMEENNLYGNFIGGNKEVNDVECNKLMIQPFSIEENRELRNNTNNIDSFNKLPFLAKQLEAKTIEEKADAIARYIYKIRKRRFNLVAGKYDVVPSGIAMQTSVDELNKLEEDFLSLFIGTKEKTVIERSFTVVPTDNEKLQRFTLFRFSANTGINPITSEADEAVVLQLTDLETNKTLSQIQETGSLKQYQNILYYRIPDKASAKVIYGSHEVFEAEISVFQLGTLLPKYISPTKNNRLF